MVGLSALVVASYFAVKSSANGVSNLMSSNKTLSTRQKLASWRRNIPSRSYRDQYRRVFGCAANQVSGSSAATAGGGVVRDNWTNTSRRCARQGS
jgi:hypothetical protein